MFLFHLLLSLVVSLLPCRSLMILLLLPLDLLTFLILLPAQVFHLLLLLAVHLLLARAGRRLLHGRRSIVAFVRWPLAVRRAIRLQLWGGRIRPVIVGARRALRRWPVVPLAVWPIVILRRRTRLVIRWRTARLYVSLALCVPRPLRVRRRRIRPVVLRDILRNIADLAALPAIILRLTRPVARVVLGLCRPCRRRHPDGCRNRSLLRFNLSCLRNGKRLPPILPNGNLLPFHRGRLGRWCSPGYHGAIHNPLGWTRRCWPPCPNKRLPFWRHCRSSDRNLLVGHPSLINPHHVPRHWL